MTALRSLCLICLLGGCAAETAPDRGDAADVLDVGPGGAADGSFPVTEAVLDEYYEGSVEALPAGTEVTIDNLRGRMDVLRVWLEAGQTFAAVLVATSGDLDPNLLVKDPEKRTLVDARDQGLLPMVSERDSVVVLTAEVAGNHYLFVSGEQLQSGGSYRVILVSLSEAAGVPLDVTDAGSRGLAQALREMEPELVTHESAGHVLELNDGTVVADYSTGDVPLAERAEINRFVAGVNSTRSELFRYFTHGGTDEDAARVGRICSSVWAAVRQSL